MRIVEIVLLAVAIAVTQAHAQTDTTFTYQGSLMNNGSPANGSYSMRFKLYDSLAGGSQVGSTVTFISQSVAEGLFAVELDFGAQAFSTEQHWLEIIIDGNTLSPRVAMTGTPYSVQTRGLFVDDNNRIGVNSNFATSEAQMYVQSTTGDNFGLLVDSSGVLGSQIGLHTGTAGYSSIAKNSFFASGWRRWSESQGAFLQEIDPIGNVNFNVAPTGAGLINWKTALSLKASNGYVGIGTTNPTARLNVKSTGGDAIVSENSGNVAKGVYGLTTAPTTTTTGIFGHTKSNAGRGVYGYADSSTGITYGVYGFAVSNQARALQGEALSSSGVTYGVYSRVVSPDGYAGYFRGGKNYFEGNVGIGVLPNNTDSLAMSVNTRRGIACFTSSTQAGTIGILGTTSATSSNGTGVIGQSFSSSGTGVLGYTTRTSGVTVGVRGDSTSFSGYDFYAAGNGIDYGTESSIRWKSNVVNIDSPLDKLAQLRGVYFDWDEEHGGQHAVGMIAEEVGKVLPEIVGYEENGIDAVGMDYSKLTPLLVEATNALRTEKDAEMASLRGMLRKQRATHQIEIEALGVENAALRNRLAALEAAVRELALQDKGEEK
jgi:Chaperone of endosialidase